MSIFLQTISVCVNYGHYLAQVVEANRPQFDRWIVITHEGDYVTRELCAKHDIEVHLTSVPFTPGVTFPKGTMINEAFKLLRPGDTWTLLLDGDMKLPPNAREILNSVCTNPRLYYTVSHRKSSEGVIVNNCCVEGFFQLFHHSMIHPYPCKSKDASLDDWDFVKTHWNHPREKFIITNMLPEHLGNTGGGWLGLPNPPPKEGSAS